jgi:hypothetical protein
MWKMNKGALGKIGTRWETHVFFFWIGTERKRSDGILGSGALTAY